MSIVDEPMSRVRFIPEINLGHVLSAGVFLASTIAAWVSLNARVDEQARALVRLEQLILTKADKEVTAMAENDLARRIAEAHQAQQVALGRIDDGFRDLKVMIREVDHKLDAKVDKPGR